MVRELGRHIVCALVLLSFPALVIADVHSAQIPKAAMKALNPADPAQAAIIQWHRSLLINDYPTFSRVEFHTAQVSDSMIRVLFDGILKFGVPRTIMISEADKKIEEL